MSENTGSSTVQGTSATARSEDTADTRANAPSALTTESRGDELIGTIVFDVNDRKAGEVSLVHRDADGKAVIVEVNTGLFGANALVPLGASNLTESGIWVPYTKDMMRSAPSFGEHGFTIEEETRLHDHYNLEFTPAEPPAGAEPADAEPVDVRAADPESADVPSREAADHERLDVSTSGVEGAPESVAEDADAEHAPEHADDQGITDVTTPNAEQEEDRSELDSGTIDGDATTPLERDTSDKTVSEEPAEAEAEKQEAEANKQEAEAVPTEDQETERGSTEVEDQEPEPEPAQDSKETETEADPTQPVKPDTTTEAGDGVDDRAEELRDR